LISASKKPALCAYGFHAWSLRFLAGAQAARGAVMSVRTFRLTRSGDKKCRTSLNFTSSDGPCPERLPWQAVEGGRIDAAKNVTHISVATNYNRREGETWKSDPQWHRITLFDKLRDRLTNATIGDLVRITGRIGTDVPPCNVARNE
jgi:Single-strand binding protein family